MQQGLESGVSAGIRAGDIAAITAKSGAGVDEQRAVLRGRTAIKLLVVQRGRVLVQPYDGLIGQFLLPLATTLQKSLMDGELAATGQIGLMCSLVTSYASRTGCTLAGHLIGRLTHALLVQLGQQQA